MDKPTYIAALTAIFSDVSGKTPSEKATEIANATADFIESYKVQAGITVQVTDISTSLPETGATTSQGNLV